MEASAHFAAQLPDLVRGIYYEGWDPSRVPEKYDVDEFADRFARAAIISNKYVPRAAAAVAAVLPRHLSPGHMDKILDQLPAAFRDLLNPY